MVEPNLQNDQDDINASPATEDGVIFSAADSGVACAKCEGVLEVAHVDNYKIAACVDCHGMLIEARLLARLIATCRAKFEGDEKQPRH